MKLPKLAALAVTFVVGAGAASAATYNFNTSGPDVNPLVMGDLTITASAVGILNFCGASVAQNSNGLGVNGCPDFQPNELDGFPLGSSEKLTFSFASTVNLDSFSLANFGSNDDFNFYIDGNFVTKYGPSAGTSTFVIGQAVNSFSIEAVGEIQSCGFLCNIDGLGNDSFLVQSVTTSPVPLPAAGWLLLAGLGGLAAAKRRSH